MGQLWTGKGHHPPLSLKGFQLESANAKNDCFMACVSVSGIVNKSANLHEVSHYHDKCRQLARRFDVELFFQTILNLG